MISHPFQQTDADISHTKEKQGHMSFFVVFLSLATHERNLTSNTRFNYSIKALSTPTPHSKVCFHELFFFCFLNIRFDAARYFQGNSKDVDLSVSPKGLRRKLALQDPGILGFNFPTPLCFDPDEHPTGLRSCIITAPDARYKIPGYSGDTALAKNIKSEITFLIHHTNKKRLRTCFSICLHFG